MVSLRVFDFEFQALLGCELIQAEVDGLGELLSQLFGDERLLAMSCYPSEKLDYHVRQLQ